MKDALESVKVAEFDGYAAGRCIGKHLVDFGARVLHGACARAKLG